MIHNFCINDFEGPLDLLLHLIRSSKMDIYDINIESITRQYLEFINNNNSTYWYVYVPKLGKEGYVDKNYLK